MKVIYRTGMDPDTRDEALLAALSDKDPITAARGRLIAAGIPDLYEKWGAAELERGTPHLVIIKAVAIHLIETYGSVAGALVTTEGHGAVTELLQQLAGKALPPVLAAVSGGERDPE